MLYIYKLLKWKSLPQNANIFKSRSLNITCKDKKSLRPKPGKGIMKKQYVYDIEACIHTAIKRNN